MSSRIGYIAKKEFYEMKPKDQWEYLESIVKYARDLEIKAEKNCEECEKTMLTPQDINIDFNFEDWRECASHCDECNKEYRKNMCQIQFELINHLANQVGEINDKHAYLVKHVFRKDPETKGIYEKAKESRERLNKHAGEMVG